MGDIAEKFIPSRKGRGLAAREKACGWRRHRGSRIFYMWIPVPSTTIGCYARRKGETADTEAVNALLPEVEIGMRYDAQGLQHMLLHGEDVTEEIRLPEMSLYASAVSAIPEVRAFLLEMQRDFARKSSVIMDGRDIGTVVLPHADVKIFLKADVEVRARRREIEPAGAGDAPSLRASAGGNAAAGL